MKPYTSAMFITKLKLNEEGTGCVLDIPFRSFGQNIVQNGKDITYRLNDPKLAGTEVLAKIDYSSSAVPFANEYDESEVAEGHAGYMGNDWETLKKDARYLKHYAVTKADTLATYTDLGVKVPYVEADKDEVTKFCEWTKEVKEIAEIDIKPIDIKK